MKWIELELIDWRLAWVANTNMGCVVDWMMWCDDNDYKYNIKYKESNHKFEETLVYSILYIYVCTYLVRNLCINYLMR